MTGRRSSRGPAAGVLLLALLAACASRAPRPEPAPPPPRETAPEPGPSAPLADRGLTRQIVELARSMLHTPYRPRGSGSGGFDCSGLTTWVYGRAGSTLPRTADEQAHEGRWVPLDQLHPGDLVFFGRSRRRISHVGIVVSEPQDPLTMIHAASSLGVVETVIVDSPYWLSRLQLGRRVLAP